MKNAMWLADFDFQTSGWIFSVSLYPNESTESVTSRFPPKMGNSSTPNSRKKCFGLENEFHRKQLILFNHSLSTLMYEGRRFPIKYNHTVCQDQPIRSDHNYQTHQTLRDPAVGFTKEYSTQGPFSLTRSLAH